MTVARANPRVAVLKAIESNSNRLFDNRSTPATKVGADWQLQPLCAFRTKVLSDYAAAARGELVVTNDPAATRSSKFCMPRLWDDCNSTAPAPRPEPHIMTFFPLSSKRHGFVVRRDKKSGVPVPPRRARASAPYAAGPSIGFTATIAPGRLRARERRASYRLYVRLTRGLSKSQARELRMYGNGHEPRAPPRMPPLLVGTAIKFRSLAAIMMVLGAVGGVEAGRTLGYPAAGVSAMRMPVVRARLSLAYGILRHLSEIFRFLRVVEGRPTDLCCAPAAAAAELGHRWRTQCNATHTDDAGSQSTIFLQSVAGEGFQLDIGVLQATSGCCKT
ncbi:hypothetical protein BKA62DRAFT_668613 [Auriculariales sp. MPI-PUGE-AT-0066]|nr:hypothetical protein BKA62DRAFT_668613 [Auriculariales sp. MPI-PUGE-AT-0066]